MTVSDKIKTVDNKIVQNKGRYSLDRQTAKILVLSAAAIKKFEYEPLGSDLKKQTDIAKKYQKLDNVY